MMLKDSQIAADLGEVFCKDAARAIGKAWKDNFHAIVAARNEFVVAPPVPQAAHHQQDDDSAYDEDEEDREDAVDSDEDGEHEAEETLGEEEAQPQAPVADGELRSTTTTALTRS